MCHSEFKRSSNNRRDLKGLHAELVEFDRSFKWKIFYPVLFCLTRWLGLQRCADILSRRSNRTLLEKYAQMLRDRGCGPRTFDPYRYHRRRGVREAHEAGGDDMDGDNSMSEEEEEEVRCVQEAVAEDRLDTDDYQPATQLFTSAEAAAASAPSQMRLVEADDFDVGDVEATKFKCKNLLNKDVGLTHINIGRSAYMSGVLKPYKFLIESLQRHGTPQQHMVARNIRRFYMVMRSGWTGTRLTEPMYSCRAFQEWVESLLPHKETLVKLIKKEARAFASVFVHSVKERLAPT